MISKFGQDMSTKISDLAKKLGISSKEFKEKVNELGFDVSTRARVLDDELAELVMAELEDSNDEEKVEPDNQDVAEVYDELIAQEREREIIKSQRKQTAGKKVKKRKSSDQDDKDLKKGVVEIPDNISVKEFSEKTGVTVAKLIGELMKNGVLANINQQIDFDTAQVIAEDMGIKIKRLRSAAGAEELLEGDLTRLLEEDDNSDLSERPPVVCVMGHVDHGKTQLLDTIREANVVAGESGGITQHIGAYQVKKKNKKITFLDTPGHEAFTAMRARGAKVTDVAILVVAADEGVKPQTIEALNHAKAAEVPIIVAINKMDKENANPDKVKAELAEQGLQPEDWGGSTVMVPVSALRGDGIDDLLDMILLTAEMEDLKANPDREAVGTVIEAHLDKSLGPVATILINTGTLKIMNNVVVGSTYGRIKLMRDHNGKNIRLAGPSQPVFVAGFDETPKSGDILHVVKNEKVARDKAEEISILSKSKDDAKGAGVNTLITQVKAEKLLRLIIKADTKGSLEAIKQSLAKIKDEEVAIKIIHSGLGAVTESDVMMASASGGMILAFHTDYFSPTVAKIADREGVQVQKYSVIYHLLEEVKKVLSGLIEAEINEVEIGKAEVKQIFLTKKKEMIVGCKVLSGKLANKAKIKVVRGHSETGEPNIVGRGMIVSLRKVDKVVDEINEGNDCGIKYSGDISLEEGDEVIAYVEEETRRELI